MISKKEIEIAMKACEAASEVILSIYNSNDWDESLKADNSPLTKADKEAHLVISKYLEQTNLPILSEEGKHLDYDIRKNWQRYWLVDPLDGTKEFLKRNGEFTVNIALIENNIPVWGIVSAPVLSKTYFVDENSKVWLSSNDGKVQLKKRETKFDPKQKGNKVVASRSHMDEKTKAFVDSMNEAVIVSMGSSLKFMMLAEGLADVYPRYAPTSEWDTAAAHAILNKLEYKIFQENSGNELIYNKENLLNPGFIAIN